MATNMFYNETRKRQALMNVDETLKKKHQENTHRLTLTKMAHTTRTFWSQADALEYMAERQKHNNNSDEILYLFSFESQPEGRRRYQVADIDIFIHEYYQLPANQRHTYEIIIDIFLPYGGCTYYGDARKLENAELPNYGAVFIRISSQPGTNPIKSSWKHFYTIPQMTRPFLYPEPNHNISQTIITIILEILEKPSKLYFDLEYDTAANPKLNGPRLTSNFIQFILNFMRKRSDDLDYSIKDVLVLDSTSLKKFSRHLIFQTKDPFLDNIAVGKFVNLILEDIHGCLINHQCSVVNNSSISQTQISSSSIVFAKNLLSSLESHLSQFENCDCTDDYSQLKYKDIVEFIINKNDGTGITWFCDMGVYTKNRAFRLLHSSKFDKQECFTVAPENQWKPIIRHCQSSSSTVPNEAERQIFMAALVYFNKPIRRFIHVDDENLTAAQTSISRTQQQQQRASQSSYTTEDIRKMSLDYPELIHFMTNLARDKKDEGNGIRISRLYKAKEIQNDFRWEISLMYVGDYKYCERIKRHHQHNNIYFVVDMRKGTYRQKCHDSDCKTFQGIERVLPKNVTPWLMMLDEEWENHDPQSN